MIWNIKAAVLIYHIPKIGSIHWKISESIHCLSVWQTYLIRAQAYWSLWIWIKICLRNNSNEGKTTIKITNNNKKDLKKKTDKIIFTKTLPPGNELLGSSMSPKSWPSWSSDNNIPRLLETQLDYLLSKITYLDLFYSPRKLPLAPERWFTEGHNPSCQVIPPNLPDLKIHLNFWRYRGLLYPSFLIIG